MLWIAQAVRTARPMAAPSDFLVFGLGYGEQDLRVSMFEANRKKWLAEV
jgi:hypothetical protein